MSALNPLNRTLVLNILIKHETLTLEDFSKEENLGLISNEHLGFLLEELVEGSYVQKLCEKPLPTYAITVSGIAEGKRLNELLPH